MDNNLVLEYRSNCGLFYYCMLTIWTAPAVQVLVSIFQIVATFIAFNPLCFCLNRQEKFF